MGYPLGTLWQEQRGTKLLEDQEVIYFPFLGQRRRYTCAKGFEGPNMAGNVRTQ